MYTKKKPFGLYLDVLGFNFTDFWGARRLKQVSFWSLGKFEARNHSGCIRTMGPECW